MSDSLSSGTAISRAMAQLNDTVATIGHLTSELDDFQNRIERYLFMDRISERTYWKTIDSNPDLAVRLLQIFEDEVKIRVKIHKVKSLLEDIHKLDDEIRPFPADDIASAERIVALKKEIKSVRLSISNHP